MWWFDCLVRSCEKKLCGGVFLRFTYGIFIYAVGVVAVVAAGSALFGLIIHSMVTEFTGIDNGRPSKLADFARPLNHYYHINAGDGRFEPNK